jgi:carboxymethylenebutenolidase
MPTATRTETITVADGSFDAHLALPSSGRGPGLVVLQEIFGVNTYIKSVCDRVAEMGYVAIAPDMFWRSEPGFTVEPEDGDAGMEAAFAKMGGFDFASAPGDLGATFDHLMALGETTTGPGVMGFCFGGTLTYLAAAALDPICAVSYYGSGVAGMLDMAGDVTCPITFHFGDADPYLPNDDVQKVVDRFAAAPEAQVVIQHEAGHAFDNSFNPAFSNPQAANAAWHVTSSFLKTHLPAG